MSSAGVPVLGSVVYTVRSSVSAEWDEEFNRWQREEHAPQLMAVPGYRGMQGFAVIDQPHTFMNMWQIDSKACFDSESRFHASRTPWRARIDPIRKSHRVDFYRPLHGDGLMAGQLPAVRSPFLVRYDLRFPSEPTVEALRNWVTALAAQPGTVYVRVMVGLADPSDVLVLHHLSQATEPLDPVTHGLTGAATAYRDIPR